MRINKEFKPWASASNPKAKGVRREVLEASYLDVEKQILISTDGCMLTRLPVEVDDGDVSGLISQDALKEAVKLSKGFAGIVWLDCTSAESVKARDGRTWPRSCPTGQKYPTWEQALPRNEGRRTARLWINPALLAAIFAAAGSPEGSGALLEFQIDGEDDARQSPIAVTVAGQGHVLMPMRLLSRAPNRVDDVEAGHLVALGKKDINEVDVEAAQQEVK